jgi:hypothetical protein
VRPSLEFSGGHVKNYVHTPVGHTATLPTRIIEEMRCNERNIFLNMTRTDYPVDAVRATTSSHLR